MHARAIHPFRRSRPSHAGFSLIQLSVLLAIAGMAAVALIPGPEAGDYLSRMKISHDRMLKIEDATQNYMTTYGHRPCPADATVDVGSQYFGREAATAGTCTGGIPAANFSGAGGSANAVAGGVPNVALGLPDDYAFDGFGHRFTYVVDKRATSKSSCLTLQGGETPISSYHGDLEIRDAAAGTLLSNTMWALISHGQDAHGAFPMQGQGTAGGYSVANRIQTGNTDTDTLKNASVDSSFVTTFSKVFVKKEKTAAFDDLTWYAEATKNTCCMGKACLTNGFRIDGIYSSGALGIGVWAADINGDGIQDILIEGKNPNSSRWELYVLFGQADRTSLPSGTFPVSSLNGTNGFILTNITSTVASSGMTTPAFGDFNHDGITDMLLSASTANNMSGASYVLFGQNNGWPSSIDATTLTSISNPKGLILSNGVTPFMGFTQSSDINGDGVDDIIIYHSYPQPATAYVIFGNATIGSIATDASTLNGSNGFSITDVTDDFHDGRMAIGDFNGDSYPDIATIGMFGSGSESNGGFIVWGHASG